MNPEIFAFVYTARRVHRYTTWHKVDLRPSTQGEFQLTRSDGSDLFRFTLTVDDNGTRTHGATAGIGSSRTVVHCLGDSFTMGWGVEDDETYPSQLARRLGSSYSVVNLGVDGYGLLATLHKSQLVADELPPDVLVYLFCPNDPVDDAITQKVQSRGLLGHAPWFVLDGLRRRTYVANIPFALKWAAYFAPILDASTDESHPQLAGDELTAALDAAPLPSGPTSTSLLELADSCRRDGRQLLFVAVGTDPVTLGFVKLCRDSQIPTLLTPLDGPYRIPGDGHLNVEGNRALAAQVSRALAPRDRVTPPPPAGP